MANNYDQSDVAINLLGANATKLRVLRRNGVILLALPEDRKSALRAYSLYQPQRLIVRLLSSALKIAIVLGFHKLLPTISDNSDLNQQLDSVLPDDIDIETVGILFGNPQHQAFRAVISYRANDQWEVGKVAAGVDGIDMLEHEARMISEVSRIYDELPKVIGVERSTNLCLLRLPFIEGVTIRSGQLKPVIDLLDGWILSPNHIPCRSHYEWSVITKTLEHYPGADSLIKSIAEIGITKSICHRDFARWNIIWTADNKLKIIDWEWGSASGMAGLDLVHLIAQDLRLVKKLSSKHLITKLISTLKLPHFQDYLVKCGWDDRHLDLLIIYLSYQEGKGRQDNTHLVEEALLLHPLASRSAATSYSQTATETTSGQILLMGQTPPPWHGQAVATQMLFRHDWSPRKVINLRMDFSEDMSLVGKFQFTKLHRLIKLILRARTILTTNPGTILFYPPASANWLPFLRDVIFLSLTRRHAAGTVFIFHAAGLAEWIKQSRIRKALAKMAYHSADLSLEVSQEKVAPHEVFLIPRHIWSPCAAEVPIDPKREQIDDRTITLLFVGSLQEGKGVQEIVRTAAALKEKGYSDRFKFSVAGRWTSASFEKSTHELVSSMKVEEMVDFIGEITGDEKWDIYRNADIFFFPSHYHSEASPIVLMEALGAGLPIISTEWSGIPKLLDGCKSATLLPIKSPKSYADAILELSAKRSSFDELSSISRNYYEEHYTPSHFIRRISDALDKSWPLSTTSNSRQAVTTTVSATKTAPNTSKIKVAAVFATMNRRDTAISCVKSLAAQTTPPSHVIVADNGSDDYTAEELIKLKDLPFTLIVHENENNLGNAGGVDQAMATAFGHGVDAVWILDDDSWPRAEALENLVQEPWDHSVVRHPLQIDPKSKLFTWPMWTKVNKSWNLVFETSQLPDKPIIPSRFAWAGALVSRQVWHKVGPVRADLFIRGEDEEYPWRIAMAGFTFEAVKDSVLDHPGPANMIHWSLFGKNLFYEQGLADWKLYYKVRNMVWLKRKQAGLPAALAMTISYAVAGCIIDSPKRLPLLIKAASHGWRSNLGKWQDH